MEIASVDRELSIRMGEDRKEKLNINLFLSGRLVSLLGTNVYSFAISLYVLKVTGSGTSFALSIFLGMLPRVLLGPIAGSLADRWDRKKLVVGLDALSGLAVLGLMGLSGIFGLQLPFIYGTTLLLAVINTFFDTTIISSIPNLVRSRSLMKINSYSSAVTSISSIAGPMLGGLIFGILPMNIFLAVNGISFLLSAVSEMFIDFKFNKAESLESVPDRKMGVKAIMEDIKEVIGFLREHKAILALMKSALLLNFFIMACVGVAYPYIVNNVVGVSSTQFGIIEASFSVGLLVTSIIIGKLPEKDKKRKQVVTCIAVEGFLMAGMGIPALGQGTIAGINTVFVYFIILVFTFSALMVMINMPINVMVQRLTPDYIMGRVIGILQTVSSGIMPLGIIIAGVLIEVLPAYMLPFISGTAVTAIAVSMMKNKSLKDF